MSVAELLRTKDFIWQFESINILLEGAVFLEHANSVNSKLRYTLLFVKRLLVQIDLCSFCLCLNMCLSVQVTDMKAHAVLQSVYQTTFISKQKSAVRAGQGETKI